MFRDGRGTPGDVLFADNLQGLIKELGRADELDEWGGTKSERATRGKLGGCGKRESNVLHTNQESVRGYARPPWSFRRSSRTCTSRNIYVYGWVCVCKDVHV